MVGVRLLSYIGQPGGLFGKVGSTSSLAGSEGVGQADI